MYYRNGNKHYILGVTSDVSDNCDLLWQCVQNFQQILKNGSKKCVISSPLLRNKTETQKFHTGRSIFLRANIPVIAKITVQIDICYM